MSPLAMERYKKKSVTWPLRTSCRVILSPFPHTQSHPYWPSVPQRALLPPAPGLSHRSPLSLEHSSLPTMPCQLLVCLGFSVNLAFSAKPFLMIRTRLGLLLCAVNFCTVQAVTTFAGDELRGVVRRPIFFSLYSSTVHSACRVVGVQEILGRKE